MSLYVQIRNDASAPWRTIGIFGRRKDAELFAEAVVRYIGELADKTGDETLRRFSRVVTAENVAVRRPGRRRGQRRPELRAVS